MSKAVYVGVDGVAHKVRKMYVGVDGVARKIKKAYVGVGGVARLFYTADVFNYTGMWTSAPVEIDGTPYTLYTLTSSGVLTLGEDAQYWMCGGGGRGSSGSVAGFDANNKQTIDFSVITYIQALSGSGGNGGYAKDGDIVAGEWVVTVGASEGASSITAVNGQTLSTTGVVGNSGGTGGGAQGFMKITYPDGNVTRSSYTKSGDGKAKIPFGIESLKAHCAGGGGGTLVHIHNDTQLYVIKGGNGGTNGANGGVSGSLSLVTPASDTTAYDGGTGGVYGGGNGGWASRTVNGSGTRATFYGGGSGGGAMIQRGINNLSYGPINSGSGYQGVCYILMKRDPVLPTLRIVKQPQSVVAADGETVNVTVEAVGEGLKYQWWFKSSTAGWQTSSQMTPTYSTQMNSSRNGYQLYCVITDKNGNTVTTDTVTITMTT